MPSDTQTRRAVGLRIREARMVAGLLPWELALIAGCPPSKIGRLEIGELELERPLLKAVALALGVKLGALWPEAGDETCAA